MVGPLIKARLNMDPSQWPVSPLHSVSINTAKVVAEPRYQDDCLTWFLTSAPESDRTVDGITRRLLIVNFAAIHTTSVSLGHALYWLLARYVEIWFSHP
jgi:cytochrome P450